MKQRQVRADKGQTRKPQAQKRTHNWQVLLNDDEHVIIENYLQKEEIDKAFFMRKAMLRAVPKSFRTLDLRTVSTDSQQEVPITPEQAPEAPKHETKTLEVETAPETAPETPKTTPNEQSLQSNPEKATKAPKTPKSKSVFPPSYTIRVKSDEEREKELAAGRKALGIED